MIVIYSETADRLEFGNIRRLISDDPNTIIFNTYENAWVDIGENGEHDGIKKIATNIRKDYKTGYCRADFDLADRLMPEK